ncbi:MAG: hypothetical protein HDT28_06395 [Clostridiales bacterium]|nr:hypothetical protein [Clostridiales bacterium]
MSSLSEEKDKKPKYYYYEFHEEYIAREVVGNRECASERFEFFLDGKWINDWDLSLSLSDATMDFGDYPIWDYEELTEEEALRRIADGD